MFFAIFIFISYLINESINEYFDETYIDWSYWQDFDPL